MRRFLATWGPGRHLAWPSLRKNRNQPAPPGAWRYGTFSRCMKQAREKARLRSRDPGHEIWKYGPDKWRHTFGSLLALSGKNITEIAKWMRNSSEVAGACYVNFNPTDEGSEGNCGGNDAMLMATAPDGLPSVARPFFPTGSSSTTGRESRILSRKGLRKRWGRVEIQCSNSPTQSLVFI